MLPYILLLVISAVFADNCSYTFNQESYSRESVLTIKGLPTNLVYNPHNKELLFTLIDLESLQNDDIQTRMDQYILRNGVPIVIDNVNGQGAAVDVKTKKVYIATDDGLHLLNKTDKANFLSLQGEDIVQLFKPAHGDILYAVMYPDNEIFAVDVVKNEKERVKNVPCAYIVAIDEDDNIFYECDSKYVKVLLKDFQEPVEFVGIGKNVARAIAVDRFNRVVLAANDGLYHLKPDNVVPRKLMNLEFIPSGIAFDGDDFYVSTNGIIYKYSGQCDK